MQAFTISCHYHIYTFHEIIQNYIVYFFIIGTGGFQVGYNCVGLNSVKSYPSQFASLFAVFKQIKSHTLLQCIYFPQISKLFTKHTFITLIICYFLRCHPDGPGSDTRTFVTRSGHNRASECTLIRRSRDYEVERTQLHLGI